MSDDKIAEMYDVAKRAEIERHSMIPFLSNIVLDISKAWTSREDMIEGLEADRRKAAAVESERFLRQSSAIATTMTDIGKQIRKNEEQAKQQLMTDTQSLTSELDTLRKRIEDGTAKGIDVSELIKKRDNVEMKIDETNRILYALDDKTKTISRLNQINTELVGKSGEEKAKLLEERKNLSSHLADVTKGLDMMTGSLDKKTAAELARRPEEIEALKGMSKIYADTMNLSEADRKMYLGEMVTDSKDFTNAQLAWLQDFDAKGKAHDEALVTHINDLVSKVPGVPEFKAVLDNQLVQLTRESAKAQEEATNKLIEQLSTSSESSAKNAELISELKEYVKHISSVSEKQLDEQKRTRKDARDARDAESRPTSGSPLSGSGRTVRVE